MAVTAHFMYIGTGSGDTQEQSNTQDLASSSCSRSKTTPFVQLIAHKCKNLCTCYKNGTQFKFSMIFL